MERLLSENAGPNEVRQDGVTPLGLLRKLDTQQRSKYYCWEMLIQTQKQRRVTTVHGCAIEGRPDVSKLNWSNASSSCSSIWPPSHGGRIIVSKRRTKHSKLFCDYALLETIVTK